jgi:uncharacterized damage-inducible protein DinB
LDDIIVNFINELSTEDLKSKVNWTNSQGNKFVKSLEIFLMHIFNHETHHRAMISLYLEMVGKENNYSTLYIYE